MNVRRLISIALIAAFVSTIAGSPTAATATTAQEQDPAELLEHASQVMIDLDSFHFEISTPVGTTMLIDEVELEGIEGDVVRPASFQATFTIGLPFFSLDLHAVGNQNNLWVSDPFTGGDNFILVASGDDIDGQIPPELILNPDQLVLQAVMLLDDPVVVGSEEIDGASATRIDGSFDLGDIELNGTPAAASGFGDIEPIGVSIWLDEESRVVRVEFSGAFLPSEESGMEIVRRVDLSAFNEPVEIELPESS